MPMIESTWDISVRADALCKSWDLPPEARIVAAADVQLSRAEAVAQRFGGVAYQDYRDLLDSKDVDAVVVATPDHWHALPSIHACQAGKDVYCEKPLTLTIREGRQMVDAARMNNRVLQTGSQQRSMVANRVACQWVREGQLGRVIEVIGSNYPSPWHCDLPAQDVPEGLNWDAWCGQTTPRPFHQDIFISRSNPGWISFRDYSGGEMTGWRMAWTRCNGLWGWTNRGLSKCGPKALSSIRRPILNQNRELAVKSQGAIHKLCLSTPMESPCV